MRYFQSCFISMVLLTAMPVQANILVNFVEGAPKDSFFITNVGACDYRDVHIEIDLTQSAGKLIFDTTTAGDGVEVCQPFEVVSGDLALIDSQGAKQDSNENIDVKDGQAVLSLLIKRLAPQQVVSFTIDVDATLRESELGRVRISDAEIKGGRVTVTLINRLPSTGVFGDNSHAFVVLAACI